MLGCVFVKFLEIDPRSYQVKRVCNHASEEVGSERCQGDSRYKSVGSLFLKMIFFFLTEARIFESFFHFKCGFVYFEGNTCCLLAKRVNWEVDARERDVSDEGYFETCEEASHTFCPMNFLYRVKESTVFIETEDLHSSLNDDKRIATNRLHSPSQGRSQSVSAVLAKL